MRVLKPPEPSLLLRPLETPQGPRLCVSLLCLFPLLGAGLRPERELWEQLPGQLEEGQLLDEGLPKARGEFLLAGSAHAPRGRSRRHLRAGVRVGPLCKFLDVHGDRHWRTDTLPRTCTEAEPFLDMPLVRARAFGGPAWEANPLGRGLRVEEGVLPLPNLLPAGADPAWADPAAVEEGTLRGCAGFGPLDSFHPLRRRLALAWAQEAPGPERPAFRIPEGLDPAFFQMAPEDQRLEGCFQGGERLDLLHLHPAHPILRSRVPRLRPRCFATRLESGGGSAFLEAPLRADTLWLFPELLLGLLVFRGCVTVTDGEAGDLERLYLVLEDPEHAPRDAAWHRAQEALRLEELEHPGAREIRQAQRLQERSRARVRSAMERTAAALAGQAPPPQAMPAGLLDRKLAQAEQALASLDAPGGARAPLRERLQAMGKLMKEGPERLARARQPYGAPAAAAPPAQPGPMAAPLAALPGQPQAAIRTLLERGARLREEALQKGRESQEMRKRAMAAARKAGGASPPAGGEPDPLASLAGLLAQPPTLLHAPPGGLDRPRGTLAAAQRIRAQGEAGRARLDALAAGQAGLPELERMAESLRPLGRREALERLRGCGLGGARLSGLDLSGENLDGADFGDCLMEACSFRGCSLRGARFSRTRMLEVDLASARLGGARLEGVLAQEGFWAGVDLEGAEIRDTLFLNLRLERAILREARLERCTFRDVDLRGGDWSGARLTLCIVQKEHAQGLRLRQGRLERCMLQHLALDGADFGGCALPGTLLQGCGGEGLRFDAALMGRSALAQCRFPGASLDGADLTRANVRDCQLPGARFRRARLDEALVEGGSLRGACFLAARGRGARFQRCDLAQARFGGADLLGAALLDCGLQEADLRGANLFGLDGRGSELRGARTEGALRGRALLPETEAAGPSGPCGWGGAHGQG